MASHVPLRIRRVAFAARAARAAATGTWVIGVSAAGCSRARVEGRETGRVVAIGVAPTIAPLLPTTGKDPVSQGAAIAIADLNAAGDRATGLRFVLRIPPAGAQTAVNAAAAFRDDGEVIGVVGPTDSQSVLDALAVYADAEHDGARGLVAISPTASSSVLSGRSAWQFRVCPDDAAASRVAALFARDSLGARRAAIVYRNDVYGKGWSRAFAASFAAGGGTVVMREPEATRLREWAEPYAAYAAREGADVLVVAGSAPDALPFVRAARAAHLRAPALGGDGLSDVRDPATRGELGDVWYTSLFDARRPRTAAGRHFVAAYTAVYGAVPTQQAALAYDAALLLGHAARAAGPERRAVRAYLERVGRSRPAFDGVTGPIAFDARHDVVGTAVTLSRVAGR